jgi:predicted outer membrane repeat protein
MNNGWKYDNRREKMKPYGKPIMAIMVVLLALIPAACGTELMGGVNAKTADLSSMVAGMASGGSEGSSSVAFMQGGTELNTNFQVNQAQLQSIINVLGGSIQDAVDAAHPGDTIFVAPGKYYENIFVDKSLAIKGSGALWTIVDGQQKDSVFTIGQPNFPEKANGPTLPSSVDVTLSGLTIRNGKAVNGGGIANFESTTVKNCNIIGNTANGNGGGIYNWGDTATVTVRACKILGNTATAWGGGIGNYNGGEISVEDSWFGKNKAGSFGGGIDNYVSTSAAVKRCLFTDNVVENGYGGGIEVQSDSTLTTDQNVFKGNSATWGGGISNQDNSKTIVTRSMFWSNRASSGGGAIYSAKDSTLVQAWNVFKTPTDSILDPLETNLR